MVHLYTNSLISSPLLIGFFHPCIVLPGTDCPDLDLQYTIKHELQHYKRKDMFYKWLIQITVCLHWFNPFVYLMAHEVNRLCELSCDESVIRYLDEKARRDYGNTLLNTIRTGGNYKDSLASVTLNESKELLKERLDAIMNFKTQSQTIKAVSFILTFFICLCGDFTGAYAAVSGQPQGNSFEQDAGMGEAKDIVIKIVRDFLGAVKLRSLVQKIMSDAKERDQMCLFYVKKQAFGLFLCGKGNLGACGGAGK